MKEMKLTTWERFHLLQCVPERGSTSEIRKHLRLIDLLELTEEEKSLVGWHEAQVMSPQGPVRTTVWGDERYGSQVDKDHEFVIEMEDADAAHLKQLADKYARWPTHRNTLMLEDKLEEI